MTMLMSLSISNARLQGQLNEADEVTSSIASSIKPHTETETDQLIMEQEIRLIQY